MVDAEDIVTADEISDRVEVGERGMSVICQSIIFAQRLAVIVGGSRVASGAPFGESNKCTASVESVAETASTFARQAFPLRSHWDCSLVS